MSGAPVLDKVTVNGPDGEFLLFCTTLVRWSPRRGTGGRGSRIKVCTGDRWQPATRSVLSYQSARTIKEGLVQNIPSSNDSAALRPDRWCSDGAAYSGSRLFATCPRDGRGVHCPSSYYRCVRTEGSQLAGGSKSRRSTSCSRPSERMYSLKRLGAMLN